MSHFVIILFLISYFIRFAFSKKFSDEQLKLKYGIVSIDVATTNLKCNETIANKYTSQYPYGNGVNLDWCAKTQKQYGTVIGKRWGPMSKETRDKWTRGQCSEYLTVGLAQTCYERWGWPFFEQWISDRELIVRGKDVAVSGDSNMECITSIKANNFCVLRNAIVDFSKALNHRSSRSFETGFITVYGDSPKSKPKFEPPGI